MTPQEKPLKSKAYGSIGHLHGSRMGPADHHVHEGQSKIATEKTRDRKDTVIVSEKLDGSCVAVARVDDVIVPLGRAGWLAATSPYEQHHLFHIWCMENQQRFLDRLNNGERFVGEWLAQAHGTKYDLRHEPFVIFDLMSGPKRFLWSEMRDRIGGAEGFTHAAIIHHGGALSVDDALRKLGPFGMHGATEQVEGAVWRVERDGNFDFLAKYVRPDKVDGCYFPEVSGSPEVWNWRPK